MTAPRPTQTNWLVIPPAPPVDFFLGENAPGDYVTLHHAKYAVGEPMTDEEWTYYCRERGKRDLYFLSKYVIGHDRLYAPVHVPLAWAWQAPNHYRATNGAEYGRVRLAMVPRGHLKTTLCTQDYALFRVIRNPDERILIYTENYRLSLKMFGFVRRVLEGKSPLGDFFTRCYPEIIPAKNERDKWSDNLLTINRPGDYTDCTFEASGVGANITGSHFTLHLVDDIVGRQENIEQMRKIISTFDNLIPLWDSLATGEMRIVGTHWAFYDPYVYVKNTWPNALVCQRTLCELNDPEDQRGRSPARADDDFTENNLIFKWYEEFVSEDKTLEADIRAHGAEEIIKEAKRLRRVNRFFFNAQFMNNPRDEGKVGFDPSWFLTFERRGDYIVDLNGEGKKEKRIPLSSCNIFILVDPTNPDGSKARVDANKPVDEDTDYVGIVVLAVSNENTWYVLQCHRERYRQDEFVDKVFELRNYWNPKFIAVEQRGGAVWIRRVFELEWRRGVPGREVFNLRDWPGGHISKPQRIGAMIPRHAEGLVRYRAGAPEAIQRGIHDLQQELLDYPNAHHDDASDALSAALQVAYPPTISDPNPAHVPSLETRELQRLDPTSRRVWEAIRKDRETTAYSPGVDYWD